MPDLRPLNLAALHDVNSPRYDSKCLKCHAAIVTGATLDAQIKTAHQVMFPPLALFGYDGQIGVRNRDCVICHPTVDFMPGGLAANIRRQVHINMCIACHHPSGTPPLYQRSAY